ncbi:MAG: hypothetical protein H7838_03060 [Magnetococcus sp. DMHC-8]
MLDWILHLLNHPWVSWSGSCIIVAWGVRQWWLLQHHSILPARQRLAADLLRLEREPHPPSPPLERSALTLENLLGAGWEHHYLHNVPNLLLGVGLFFTLIGLLAAVVFLTRELQATTLTDARQAMDGVLYSASLKFLASLSGLTCAFLFSWGARRQRTQLEQQLTLLCQRLDALPVQPITQAVASESRLEEAGPTDPLAVLPELSPVVETSPEPESLPMVKPLPGVVPLWMEEPLPTLDEGREEAAPRTGTEKNMDKPVKTLDTGDGVQDKTLTMAPPAAGLPTLQEKPPPVAIPAAQPAPKTRGPGFAQLAGDYLQARQKRRTPSSEKSVQQTK